MHPRLSALLAILFVLTLSVPALAGSKPLVEGFPVRAAGSPFGDSPPLFFGQWFDDALWVGTLAAANPDGTIAVLSLGRFTGEEAAHNWQDLSSIPIQAHGPLTLAQVGADQHQIDYSLLYAMGPEPQAQGSENLAGRSQAPCQDQALGGVGALKALLWLFDSGRHHPYFDLLTYLGLDSNNPIQVVVAADLNGSGVNQAVYVTASGSEWYHFKARDPETGAEATTWSPSQINANSVSQPSCNASNGNCGVAGFNAPNQLYYYSWSPTDPLGPFFGIYDPTQTPWTIDYDLSFSDYDGKMDNSVDTSKIMGAGNHLIQSKENGSSLETTGYGQNGQVRGSIALAPTSQGTIAAASVNGSLGVVNLTTGQSNQDQQTGLQARQGGERMSEPVIADINGDGELEILASLGTEVVVMDLQGRVITGPGGSDPDRYQTGATLTSSPVVADIDHDELLEIVVAGSNSDGGGWFWAWKTTAPAGSARPWPMAYQNPQRNAYFSQ